MKRDMELIRLLLLAHEGNADISPDDYSEEEIDYHNALLMDAGLVLGKLNPPFSSSELHVDFVGRLTWSGHDFLDATRDQSVWRKVKDATMKVGGAVSFEMMLKLAKYYAIEKLSSVGIDLSSGQ